MDTVGVTNQEIAESCGVSVRTVEDWSREPGWPTPIGKRGRRAVRDPAAVAAALEARGSRKAPKGPAPVAVPLEGLLSPREIAERSGLAWATVRDYAAKGRFGEPVERDGVKLYPVGAVDAGLAARRPEGRPRTRG